MTVHEMLEKTGLEVIQLEDDRPVEQVYCCDLLSVAMSRAPENGAWVTVMGNQNVIAVATLTDISVIVIAEGYQFDEAAKTAARGKVTLLRSTQPIFETAAAIAALL